jgi:hypothetical protein
MRPVNLLTRDWAGPSLDTTRRLLFEKSGCRSRPRLVVFPTSVFEVKGYSTERGHSQGGFCFKCRLYHTLVWRLVHFGRLHSKASGPKEDRQRVCRGGKRPSERKRKLGLQPGPQRPELKVGTQALTANLGHTLFRTANDVDCHDGRAAT